MDVAARIRREFAESAQSAGEALAVLVEPIARAVGLIVDALFADGKILACGGGNGMTAERFASVLVSGFERQRPPIAAIALGGGAGEAERAQLAAAQVAALGRAGDVLVAVDAPGDDAGVLAAVRTAREQGLRIVAVTGAGGGEAARLLAADDVEIRIPLERPARIHEVQLLVLHCLFDGIDATLIGADT